MSRQIIIIIHSMENHCLIITKSVMTFHTHTHASTNELIQLERTYEKVVTLLQMQCAYCERDKNVLRIGNYNDNIYVFIEPLHCIVCVIRIGSNRLIEMSECCYTLSCERVCLCIGEKS